MAVDRADRVSDSLVRFYQREPLDLPVVEGSKHWAPWMLKDSVLAPMVLVERVLAAWQSLYEADSLLLEHLDKTGQPFPWQWPNTT